MKLPRSRLPVSQPNLQDDRQNAGNPDLVPPQSWEVEAEVGHELGPWGKTRLRGYYYKIQDIIDIIPIGDDGEGVGNLPKATQAGIESVSTINFDPIGFKGAKLDLTLGYEHTSVKDPLIGDNRPISGGRNRWANFAFRHDIPGSKSPTGSREATSMGQKLLSDRGRPELGRTVVRRPLP